MKVIHILVILALACSAWAKPQRKQHHKMPLKTSLVAYWDMEQDPFLFPVHDQSGNGNHLTGVNAPTLATGKIDQGIEFDGVDQYLTLAPAAGISHQGGEFTVAMWIKPLALRHFGVIAANGEWGIGMRLVGSEYFLNIAVEDEEVTSTVPLEVGQWYFVTLGWYNSNGTFVWASVNLEDRLRTLQSGLTPIPSNELLISNAASFPVAFVVDDTAIWRRNVSDLELTQIYNGGDGLPLSEWDVPGCASSIECCQ